MALLEQGQHTSQPLIKEYSPPIYLVGQILQEHRTTRPLDRDIVYC